MVEELREVCKDWTSSIARYVILAELHGQDHNTRKTMRSNFGSLEFENDLLRFEP